MQKLTTNIHLWITFSQIKCVYYYVYSNYNHHWFPWKNKLNKISTFSQTTFFLVGWYQIGLLCIDWFNHCCWKQTFWSRHTRNSWKTSISFLSKTFWNAISSRCSAIFLWCIWILNYGIATINTLRLWYFWSWPRSNATRCCIIPKLLFNIASDLPIKLRKQKQEQKLKLNFPLYHTAFRIHIYLPHVFLLEQVNLIGKLLLIWKQKKNWFRFFFIAYCLSSMFIIHYLWFIFSLWMDYLSIFIGNWMKHFAFYNIYVIILDAFKHMCTTQSIFRFILWYITFLFLCKL